MTRPTESQRILLALRSTMVKQGKEEMVKADDTTPEGNRAIGAAAAYAGVAVLADYLLHHINDGALQLPDEPEDQWLAALKHVADKHIAEQSSG